MASHRYTTEQVTSAKYDNGTHVMTLRVADSFHVYGSVVPSGTRGSDQFFRRKVSFESLRSILDESQLRQVFSADVRLNQFCQKSASKFPGKRTIPPAVAAHTAGATGPIAPASTVTPEVKAVADQPLRRTGGCQGLGSSSRRKRCHKRRRARKRFLKRCEVRVWRRAPFLGPRHAKTKCRDRYKSKQQAKAECQRNYMKDHGPDFRRLYEAGFFGKPGKSSKALLRKEARAFCRRTRKAKHTK